MPISQNLRFKAVLPGDAAFEHPAGAGLMRRLSGELAAGGWNTDEMENWRDCGWSVVCRNGSSELQIIISQMQGGERLLQVGPLHMPGLIGRLFGRERSASPGAVHELAVAVHRALSHAQMPDNPLWRWDGFPRDTDLTPKPQVF